MKLSIIIFWCSRNGILYFFPDPTIFEEFGPGWRPKKIRLWIRTRSSDYRKNLRKTSSCLFCLTDWRAWPINYRISREFVNFSTMMQFPRGEYKIDGQREGEKKGVRETGGSSPLHLSPSLYHYISLCKRDFTVWCLSVYVCVREAAKISYFLKRSLKNFWT